MKKLTKLTTTALTIGMLAVTGTTVFATTGSTDNSAVCKVEMTAEQKAEMQEKMKSRLSEQLKAGKITQEQYDERISAIESGQTFMRGHGKGEERAELTAEQKAEMKKKVQERLAAKLAEGKITQDEYDQALTDLEEGKFRFGGHGKGKDGERTELTEEQKAERLTKMNEKLAEDLNEGKITQEQYDEMIRNIESGKMMFRGHKKATTDQES